MKVKVFWLIFTLTILRLIVAGFPGLGVDEAHYYLYGQYLDWSYFDHPPLVGWTHFLFSWLPANEWTVRLPAILLSILTCYFTYLFLLRAGANEKQALWGVLALNVSFMPHLLFLGLVPDTFHMVLLFPLIFITRKVEERSAWQDWVWAGVLLGLAGLSKYTAFLFVISVVLYFLWQKKIKHLIQPKLLIVGLIGLIFILPILYWNIQNHFISFKYQNDHVLNARHIDFLMLAQSIGLQIASYSPLLFFMAIYGWVRSFWDKNEFVRIANCFGSVIFIFFTYSSLYNVALPHWPILFYLIYIPLSTYYLLSDYKRWKKFYVYFSILSGIFIWMVIYFELIFRVYPFKDFETLHRDLYGWDLMMNKAYEVLNSDTNLNIKPAQPPKALGVVNWTLGSRARFYNHDRAEIFVLDDRFDQFDLWEKHSPKGYDILIINDHYFHINVAEKYNCAKIEIANTFDVRLKNHLTDQVEYTWCRNYQGLKQAQK